MQGLNICLTLKFKIDRKRSNMCFFFFTDFEKLTSRSYWFAPNFFNSGLQIIFLTFTHQKLSWFEGFEHGEINFYFNFRLSYLYDCIFLNSLVIFKHFLDLYLGYVASQSVFSVHEIIERKFLVTFILG